MKVTILLILACSILTAGVFAGGKAEAAKPKEVNLELWSHMVSQPALDTINAQIIAKYQTQTPGVKVKWLHIPYAGFREKLLTAAAGAQLPDAFADGFNMSGLFQAKGIAENLDKYVAKWEQWGDVASGAKFMTMFKGSCYGIPFRIKAYIPLMNTDAYRKAGLDPNKPPANWDEFLAALKKLTTVENGKVAFVGMNGLDNKTARIRFYDLLLQMNGGRLLNDDGTPAFNNPKGVEAVEYLVKLYKTVMPDGVAPLTEANTSNFTAGLAGLSILQSWTDVWMAFNAKDEAFFKRTKVFQPFASGTPGSKPKIIYDGDMMLISARSPAKDAAWDFVKFFYTKENHKIFMEANFMIPIFNSMFDQPFVKNTPFFKDMMEQEKYTWEMANTVAYRSARDMLLAEIDKVVFGKQTAKQALDASEKLWYKEIEATK